MIYEILIYLISNLICIGFLLLVVLSSSVSPQNEVYRLLIQGHITGDKSLGVANIHRHDISSQKGTITKEDGGFQLAVAVNDGAEAVAAQIPVGAVVVQFIFGSPKNKPTKIEIERRIVTHLDVHSYFFFLTRLKGSSSKTKVLVLK